MWCHSHFFWDKELIDQFVKKMSENRIDFTFTPWGGIWFHFSFLGSKSSIFIPQIKEESHIFYTSNKKKCFFFIWFFTVLFKIEVKKVDINYPSRAILHCNFCDIDIWQNKLTTVLVQLTLTNRSTN